MEHTKGKIKYFFLILGGLIFLFGFCPFIFAGVRNTGSIVLMLFGTGLSAVVLLWDAACFTVPARFIWWRRIRCSAVVALAICFTGGVGISIPMIGAIYNVPSETEQYTLIVLGCQVKDGEPSLMLRRRLDMALAYFKAHTEVPIIVSGGPDELAEVEAEVMKKYLVERGIPEAQVYTEVLSHNTKENVFYSAAILYENQLPEAVIIVSDGFHVFRGSIYAEKCGFKKIATLSSDTPWTLLPVFWVREWFGVCKALFLD